ncbi:Microtubule binding protein [Lasiodiplodia theobromae]|uniref:Microtubule binding protein n=1 Tax=Lasiodiplodia theobromae TaxID=45133 RepID=UPI0015C2F6DD|nr:Microtubule binding protein [Lasiodiplodia theobromae]KAF4544484.1 Microtubule binding protein [Lasiodiplodia theobromae]
MDATSPELEQALLECANTFGLSRSVKTWKDLQDGTLLWEMLKLLDPDYFTGDLPEDSQKTGESWISRWQNMKFIDKAMTTYLREVAMNEGLIRLLNPDLKAIAIDSDVVQSTKVRTRTPAHVIRHLELLLTEIVCKMLKGLLMLGFSSEKANPVLTNIVSKMPPTDQGHLAIMAQTIHVAMEKAMEPPKQDESVEEEITSDGEARPDAIQRDPELEREERLIKANQEIKRLQTKLSETLEDLDDERKKNAQLDEALVEARVLQETRGRRTDDDEVTELKIQADKDRDYIAQLETDLEEARNLNESQGRQVERLKADAETKQELRDENQLLKAERDELLQKTKGMENLRKKVEHLQEQVKVQQGLQQRLQSLTEDQQELDQLREMNGRLKTMNEETMQTLATTEADLFEVKQTKSRLEQELKGAIARAESATAMSNRYQTENQQLEERLREVEDRSTGIEGLGSLADQLKDDDMDTKSIARKSIIVNTDNADVELLQQKIELLTARCQRVEEKYLDVFQENLGLQAALQDEQSLKEGDDPFVHQTTKLHAAEAEVKELTNKVHEITAENMEIKAKLAELTGTGKMDGASSADHQTMKENYEQLLAAHDNLQKHAKTLDNEIDDWRALLRHKLLNADILRQEDAEALQSNEYKLLQEQLTFHREAADEEADQIKIAIASDVIKKLSSGLADLSSRDQRIADLESMVKTLKTNLERIKKEAGDKASVDVQKELQALQRENKLIMSAWYDMANRLQSNTVVLQRTKTETPKSWLGRQRMEASRGIAAGLGGIGASFRR